MMIHPTREQLHAALEVLLLMGIVIREAKTIPAGELYAIFMGGMGLDAFEMCVKRLVDAGLVKRHPSHLLEWTGPQPTKPVNN